MSAGRLRLLVVPLTLALAAGCVRAVRQDRSPDRATGAGFRWDLPAGFPVPLVPADNPMSEVKAELGRRLFYEVRLSGNETFSCASCHRQELAFTDGRAQALGSTGARHPRGAMSLANVAYLPVLGWDDPTRTTLEEQVAVPLFNEEPVEMGLAGKVEEVLRRLRRDRSYRRLFARAFPDERRPFRLENVVRALACFERTLLSGNSPYDRLVYWDETDALEPAARRGMRLFFSERLGCSGCHAGFNLSGPVRAAGLAPADAEFHNTGLYNVGGTGDYPAVGSGLDRFSGEAHDRGRFRTPTLRNIALTAPYMHDGSLGTLDDVLDHYARGGRRIEAGPHAGDGRDSPLKSDRIRGFALDPTERSDLLAFLHALTDERFLKEVRSGP